MELEAPPLLLETGSSSVPPKGPGGRSSTHAATTTTTTRDDVHRSHPLDLSLGIALHGLGDVARPPRATAGGGGGGGGGGAVPQQAARAGSGTALGAKRWFSETAAGAGGGGGGGYVDPWSLAARQETAALEQRTLAAYRRNIGNTVVAAAAPSPAVLPSSTLRAPPSSPVVGWPPVRAFRKNLVTPFQPNPADRGPDEMIEQDSKKKTKGDHEPAAAGAEAEAKATMFVKVNMEGCSVGRKVDLMAHNSYQSLSSALQKMFHNFSTVGYSRSPKPNVEDNEPISANYILLYEDNEGDRLLVGDVPWELFVSSVKRLYIADGSKDARGDEGRKTENHRLVRPFEQEVKAEG